MFLLFSTNLIYAKFDSLRALKKEVAKDDQSEKGKAKTKEFFFPIDATSCCVFFAKLGKVGLTSFLKHTQHGHLRIAGENHMIFPQLIFIFNFLAFSFSTSTLLSLLLMKFLIHQKKKKKQESGRDSHQSYSTFMFFTIRPTTSRLWLALIELDCSNQPYVQSNWRLQLSFPSCRFCIYANALLLSAQNRRHTFIFTNHECNIYIHSKAAKLFSSIQYWAIQTSVWLKLDYLCA